MDPLSCHLKGFLHKVTMFKYIQVVKISKKLPFISQGIVHIARKRGRNKYVQNFGEETFWRNQQGNGRVVLKL
jgi:hypothetical protein